MGDHGAFGGGGFVKCVLGASFTPLCRAPADAAERLLTPAAAPRAAAAATAARPPARRGGRAAAGGEQTPSSL